MKLIIITLFVIPIFILGCASNQSSSNNLDNNIIPEEQILPEVFTINLYSDGTSSGASRYYRSSASFEGDKLVAATKSYESSGNSGNNYCTQTYDTVANSWNKPVWEGPHADWSKKNNKEPDPSCHNLVYLNRKELEDAINSKILVPKSEGCHYKNCFEIIK